MRIIGTLRALKLQPQSDEYIEIYCYLTISNNSNPTASPSTLLFYRQNGRYVYHRRAPDWLALCMKAPPTRPFDPRSSSLRDEKKFI